MPENPHLVRLTYAHGELGGFSRSAESADLEIEFVLTGSAPGAEKWMGRPTRLALADLGPTD